MSNRIPSWGQVARVYAIIVFIISSWTLLWFFWKLPSWRFFLNLSEILTALAYAITTNFAESVLVVLAPVCLSVLLPKKWFYDVFIARGAALAAGGLGYMMWLAYQLQSMNVYPSLPAMAWSLALAAAVIVLVVILAGRVSVARRTIELLADRMTIFLYISIPVSVISFLAILVRWAAINPGF